jgi:hypothetical protein
MLPNTLLNQLNRVMRFVVITASPAFATSSDAATLAASDFRSKARTERQKEEAEKKCEEGYGVSLGLKEALDKAVFRFAFAEDTMGANDEARMCLKSVKGLSWGACEDYEVCVKALQTVWNERVAEGGTPLTVNVFLPEEDLMVGEKGMKYFENCWREENRGRGMRVECVRWKGTDHETTSNASNEAIPRMFEVVKGSQTVASMTD